MKTLRMPRLALPLAGLLCWTASCDVEQPGVGSDRYESPAFQHDPTSDATCTSCHETDRPAAFKDHPHGGGKDCGTCHVAKDDSSGWLPRRAFSHAPMPTSCLDCHIKQRPEPPHAASGDCAGCHQYPKWK